MTMKEEPNRRWKCKFYVLGPTAKTAPTTDSLGQLTQEFSLYGSGVFAKEKPSKPREVREGDRAVAEQSFILIGTWTKTLSNVTHGMYCFIPSISKLFVVDGNATDPKGNRDKVHIYIVDNVTLDIRQLMPGAVL